MHLVKHNIRPSAALRPLNIIHIPGPHKLAGQQLPNRAWEARHRRKARGPRRLATQNRSHAPDVLVPQVPAWPSRRARRRRCQAREDVELARAGERRCGVEDEVQRAGLAAGGGGDLEGHERGDVADATVLEDLAGASVEVDGASPDAVLGDGSGDYDVGAAGDGLRGGESGGEAEDGGGDGGGEELHFDCYRLVFKWTRSRKCCD